MVQGNPLQATAYASQVCLHAFESATLLVRDLFELQAPLNSHPIRSMRFLARREAVRTGLARSAGICKRAMINPAHLDDPSQAGQVLAIAVAGALVKPGALEFGFVAGMIADRVAEGLPGTKAAVESPARDERFCWMQSKLARDWHLGLPGVDVSTSIHLLPWAQTLHDFTMTAEAWIADAVGLDDEMSSSLLLELPLVAAPRRDLVDLVLLSRQPGLAATVGASPVPVKADRGPRDSAMRP